MTTPNKSPLALLEPGALQSGALFRSLVSQAAKNERLPPGTRMGPFRIVGELGAGGMGVVYRAERDDGQYQQQVAIKCVASVVNADALAMFRRERQILAEMRHPHIARLLDGGQLDDGRLWFAMELIEGARIDAHVHASNPTVAARIGLLRQVIDAVACAHQRLLLHRDIKPANVLIDADGSAKLLDFGIARLLDGGETGDGQPWLAIEHVDGLPLFDYAARHAPRLRDRLALFDAMLDAVAHAHQHLVIHRDLKPANVLVNAAGEVKLLDFGIARLVDADTADARETSTRVFSLGYASPEQRAPMKTAQPRAPLPTKLRGRYQVD